MLPVLEQFRWLVELIKANADIDLKCNDGSNASATRFSRRLATMASSPSNQKIVADFHFARLDASGVSCTERLVVDAKGHVNWHRDEEIRVFRRSDVVGVSYVTRWADPDDFRAFEFGREGHGLFAFMEKRLPVVLAVILALFNVFSVAVVIAFAFAWTLWQVFPGNHASYDMSAGPDYRPLTLSAIQAFCMLFLSALVAYWLEVETASFLGWKPKVCRRVWLVWSNRTVLCCYFLWSFYVFVACPVAYSVTWKLDCTTDLCEAGSTGVATCGVNGCTCSSIMDMSCTPAISKMGALCASVQQPLCRHVNSTGPVSGAHIPMLMAAFVMSGLGCLLGLLWFVNMIFIYGSWTLECGQARQLAQKQARVHHHRFAVSFRSRATSGLPVIITLSAKEDPEEVIKVLLPQVDLGDPLFYGENDGASTDVPPAEDDPEQTPVPANVGSDRAKAAQDDRAVQKMLKEELPGSDPQSLKEILRILSNEADVREADRFVLCTLFK
eukprot:s87_g13.t1